MILNLFFQIHDFKNRDVVMSEFMKEGFVVRDQLLFNDVFGLLSGRAEGALTVLGKNTIVAHRVVRMCL